MAEITTGRVEGRHIVLDEGLPELEGKRVRVTIELVEGPPPTEPDDARRDEPESH